MPKIKVKANKSPKSSPKKSPKKQKIARMGTFFLKGHGHNHEDEDCGMLGKLLSGGAVDRKLFYFLDLNDDNELMREFMMKTNRQNPDIL